MAEMVTVPIADFKDQRWYVVTIWNFKRNMRRFEGTVSPYKFHKIKDALLKRHPSLSVSPRGVEPLVYRMRSAGRVVMVLALNESEENLVHHNRNTSRPTLQS